MNIGKTGSTLIAIFTFSCASVAPAANYLDSKAEIETRIDDLLGRMTLVEKIELVAGHEFNTRPNLRLGIPSLKMTDGPLGVGAVPSTAFPAGIAMAASFDVKLIESVGVALGEEVLSSGRNMLLGPCVNLSRSPFGGRNFESFGEDPELASQITRAYVKGLQSQGVVSTVKHFALNEQETDRMTINVKADERSMHELHLRAFKAAVDQGVWAVMSSYNKVNATYASENKWLLTDLLRGRWGFRGLVVSDWGATHSTVPSALAGLDLEMPRPEYFGDRLYDAVLRGEVAQEVIDAKVRRILRVLIATGIFDRDAGGRDLINEDGRLHRQLARKVAEESLVLLKNDADTLPLDASRIKTLAVIGPNAAVARTGGGGSSMVNPPVAVSAMQGLKELLEGAGVEIRYAVGTRNPGDFEEVRNDYLFTTEDMSEHGLKAEYFNNRDLKGEPIFTRTDPTINFDFGWFGTKNGIPEDNFSVRWTGILRAPVSGPVTLAVRNDDGVRVFIDDQLVINDWHEHSTEVTTARFTFEEGRAYKLRVEYFENTGAAIIKFGWYKAAENEIEEAAQVAKSSDVALVFAGLHFELESEGFDRATLALPTNQVELIEAVAAANPKTVVVLNSGTPILMPWLDKVAAVLHAWYPGQEGGYAVADAVFGKFSPSGKLPVSFIKKWEDSSAFGAFPGQNGEVTYSEGIFMGYRHLDKDAIDPLFPFGHGLSYTQFEYSKLQVSIIDKDPVNPEVYISADVTNTGKRSGAEVVQLYVGEENPTVARPVRELKGFEKVFLNPGESMTVLFRLKRDAFAFYDVKISDWNVNPGTYSIALGASSRDLRLGEHVKLGD